MLANRTYFPPPKSDASCQLCQDLRIRREDEHSGFLGVPLWKMADSARRGCFICRVLLEAVLELTKDFVVPEHLPGKEIIGFTIRSEATVNEAPGLMRRVPAPLSLVLQTEYSQVAELEVFCLEDKPTKWQLLGPGRHVHQDASQSDCIALVKSWINNCVESHTECARLSASDPVMPDRLVYVGKDFARPYLYINSPAARGKYAALSHCWGGKISQSLRKNTLPEFVEHIPSAALPLTFQHAIEVCQNLGIEYLWIDSLCIIQDKKDDWLVQSAKMYEYYSNSWVTIATDGAADSAQGFLRDPNRVSKVMRFDCPGPNDDPSGSTIYIRRKGIPLGFDTFAHHVWNAPRQSALSYRGWTLQESILSPRILHYTAEEVTFECRTESRCECQLRAHSKDTAVSVKMAIQTAPFNSKWAMVVDHYSSRDLTEQSDKLTAISGVARSMQPQTSSLYWAGLWSGDFPAALLWMVYDYDGFERPRTSRRIGEYQAPSWSWASVTGRVILANPEVYPDADADFEILGVHLVTLGGDPYGALKEASIKVRGYLAPVDVGLSSAEARHQPRPQDRFKIASESGADSREEDFGVFPDVYSAEEEIVPGQRYWVLLVGGSGSGILLSKDPTKPCCYSRVGRVDARLPGYQRLKAICTRQDLELL
ncbi:heterokaryon incompatibility protein-domain-containing protein [Aspergillus multicolor]|uniref:HET domain-containing protein n=1 Tax=Aspergillus multicolor TaxID=41759 RepID=UPI003CCDDEB7